jgi:2'-5' RNA ligase
VGSTERRRASRENQGTLGGFERCPASDRLFFAVHPDPHTAQQMVALAEMLRVEHGLRGKRLPADRLHVTLHHLGDHCGLPESLIEAARAAATSIAMPPFETMLDCAGSFPGRGKRPCVLRSATAGANQALHALQGKLGERLREAGLGRYIERRFTPHVTLLYDERGIAAEAIPPIAWTVHQFALVHSLLGRGEHRVLAVWDFKP